MLQIPFWGQKIYNDEKNGIEDYRKGQYARAFLIFENTAKLGLKGSQYYLGFMYLKGHHVEMSIETGMVWLGVAAELEIGDWVALYEQIYVKLDAAQQNLIQSKLAYYISKYGMASQKITCEKRASLGSRKKRLYCEKYVPSIEMSETFR
jgi:TPR repeat protein